VNAEVNFSLDVDATLMGIVLPAVKWHRSRHFFLRDARA
jgi:hypothetical protein